MYLVKKTEGRNYFLENFWVDINISPKTYTIGFKDQIVFEKALAFNVFEDKILAICTENMLFIYEIKKDASKLKNALKLIRKLSKKGLFEYGIVELDNYIYNVSFDCSIVCIGRY